MRVSSFLGVVSPRPQNVARVHAFPVEEYLAAVVTDSQATIAGGLLEPENVRVIAVMANHCRMAVALKVHLEAQHLARALCTPNDRLARGYIGISFVRATAFDQSFLDDWWVNL
jgi:hypothetical protein